VVLAQLEVSNDTAGFAEAVGWIAEHAPGPRVVVGLEGTRSYGIGLSRTLQQAGLLVIEVEQPSKKDRRGKGKSDPIDAHHALLSTLRADVSRLPTPRADGPREGLRILLVARREMATHRTRMINQLHALLLTGDDRDRDAGRGAFSATTLDSLARRRGRAEDTVEQSIRRAEIRRLATAIRASGRELVANKKTLQHLVQQLAPHLLDRVGVGPVSASQALVSFSHAGRCRSESAFAMLAGTAPLPANSGQRQSRHRLNRGGDRQLNAAIHAIVLTRWRSCTRTASYITKARATGKTDREIRRNLKRYVTRELFRALTAAAN